MPKLLITPKTDPDLDGVACAIAFAELMMAGGRDGAAYIAGRPDAEARFVLAHLGWRATNPPTENAEFVLVDASDLVGMPPEVTATNVVEVIDHRFPHAADLFERAAVQVEAVGAAATLIAERFVAAKIAPSRQSGTLLQAAIYSNTQALRGSVTTARDQAAAAWLADRWPLHDGDSPTPPGPQTLANSGFLQGQFAARGAEIREDLEAALQREMKTFAHPAGEFMISQLELPGAFELFEQVAGHLRAFDRRTMVNLVDPVRAESAVVAVDSSFAAWLSDQVGLEFAGSVAISPRAMLRKQIVARIFEAMI